MINFYWYENCSTCKKAKAWLDQNNISYNLLDLIGNPPSEEQLVTWMETTEIPVHKFFNSKGIIYREEGLKEIVHSLTIEEAAKRLTGRGMLIKRPILENNGNLFFGFAEEEYETLI